MPSKAMLLNSDSQNPSASAVPDMPLYAVVKNGEYTLLDVQDTPCLTFTPSGRSETKCATREEKATQLLKYLRDNPYEAGFLIDLIESAAISRNDPAKDHFDYLLDCGQIFLQLDHCLTRSEA